MLDIETIDRDYEKKVESFAKKTMNELQTQSKMFGTTVNNFANEISVRK